MEAEEAYCKDCKSIYSSLKYTKDHHIFNFDELIKDRSLQVSRKLGSCEMEIDPTIAFNVILVTLVLIMIL